VTHSVEMRVKAGGGLMHLKSYEVDGKTLRTGAANFSASGEKQQDNDLIVIESAEAAAAFERGTDCALHKLCELIMCGMVKEEQCLSVG
jgi:phosphatidylserine/phosphatidylglycerophosphate/cardiolipin synthase-like enzyme